jgi:hypothetical protein
MKHNRNESGTCCMEVSPARKFCCPLTNTIMEEPVTAPCCGTNFERNALTDWMRKNGNRCPQSGRALLPSDLRPNTKLQWEILYLERTNGDLVDGSERSPTSTTPISPPSKADSPPINPRSTHGISTPKTINHKRGTSDQLLSSSDSTLASTTIIATQAISPCTSPISSISTLKKVDSAPALPQRFVSGLSPLPKVGSSQSAGCQYRDLDQFPRRISASSVTENPCWCSSPRRDSETSIAPK